MGSPISVRTGISACLPGEKVRDGGGHKLDRLLKKSLSRYLQYVPACPEVKCGLGAHLRVTRPRLHNSTPGVVEWWASQDFRWMRWD